MIEHEYKYLLNKTEYERVYSETQKRFGFATTKIQTNYYYDDDVLSLNQCGTTVRIRKSGGDHKLQIKRHEKEENGCHISKEEQCIVDSVSETIECSGFGTLKLYGSMETRRCSFAVCDGVRLELDISTYLGKTDYESEIEFKANADKRAADLVLSLDLKETSYMNKSQRFFMALKGDIFK